MSAAQSEIMWLHGLISELGFPPTDPTHFMVIILVPFK